MYSGNLSHRGSSFGLTSACESCYAVAMLRYVLLGLLADGRPAHGYALMKAYAIRSGVRLSIGNVYRELQRLAASGFIQTVANPAGADPRRAPYAITGAGRDALTGWLCQGPHLMNRALPDELSYRLALLGDMDTDRGAKFLDLLHEELWQRVKFVERDRAAAAQRETDAGPMFPTLSALLGRQAKHLAADIEIVEEMRTRFAAFQRRLGRPSGAAAPPERKSVRTTRQKTR